MITLSKDMYTGVEEIDIQHQELVNRINEVINMRDRAHFKDETRKTLDFLAEYVIKHFNDEEALQQKIGYPGFEKHKAEHKVFLERFVKFREELEKEGHSTKLALDINSSLIQWVLNHIRTADGDIGKYYREQNK
jgi:hemerythrin-like metal-binding protein